MGVGTTFLAPEHTPVPLQNMGVVYHMPHVYKFTTPWDRPWDPWHPRPVSPIKWSWAAAQSEHIDACASSPGLATGHTHPPVTLLNQPVTLVSKLFIQGGPRDRYTAFP